MIYQNGTKKPFYYPRVHDYPVTTKYVKERYRKFFERVRLDENRWFWPYVGRRIALLAATDPANPPVKVRITRHWLKIAPPGVKQNPNYSSHMFYEHSVDQQKLRQDKGW